MKDIPARPASPKQLAEDHPLTGKVKSLFPGAKIIRIGVDRIKSKSEALSDFERKVALFDCLAVFEVYANRRKHNPSAPFWGPHHADILNAHRAKLKAQNCRLCDPDKCEGVRAIPQPVSAKQALGESNALAEAQAAFIHALRNICCLNKLVAFRTAQPSPVGSVKPEVRARLASRNRDIAAREAALKLGECASCLSARQCRNNSTPDPEG
jgi:hypothetical protein